MSIKMASEQTSKQGIWARIRALDEAVISWANAHPDLEYSTFTHKIVEVPGQGLQVMDKTPDDIKQDELYFENWKAARAARKVAQKEARKQARKARR